MTCDYCQFGALLRGLRLRAGRLALATGASGCAGVRRPGNGIPERACQDRGASFVAGLGLGGHAELSMMPCPEPRTAGCVTGRMRPSQNGCAHHQICVLYP